MVASVAASLAVFADTPTHIDVPRSEYTGTPVGAAYALDPPPWGSPTEPSPTPYPCSYHGTVTWTFGGESWTTTPAPAPNSTGYCSSNTGNALPPRDKGSGTYTICAADPGDGLPSACATVTFTGTTPNTPPTPRPSHAAATAARPTVEATPTASAAPTSAAQAARVRDADLTQAHADGVVAPVGQTAQVGASVASNAATPSAAWLLVASVTVALGALTAMGSRRWRRRRRGFGVSSS